MAAKSKAPKPEPVIFYRSRPTAANPFGEVEPPTEGKLAAVLARGRADRDAELEPVIEYRVPGSTWAAYHPTVTCEELQRRRLAREKTESYFDHKAAKMRSTTRWEIDPAGYAAIRDAASADPLTFSLDNYTVNR